ncbi:hypothetical protein HUJ04_010010 [Dendroctonus ponderosae]|nr:hypothetical protein HUJ04_010010 [Dendroctonus ponderosae]
MGKSDAFAIENSGASDQVVIAEYKQDLSYMGRKLKEEYEREGLAINSIKCEYLAAGFNECKNLELQNGGNSNDEVQARMNKSSWKNDVDEAMKSRSLNEKLSHEEKV